MHHTPRMRTSNMCATLRRDATSHRQTPTPERVETVLSTVRPPRRLEAPRLKPRLRVLFDVVAPVKSWQEPATPNRERLRQRFARRLREAQHGLAQAD